MLRTLFFTGACVTLLACGPKVVSLGGSYYDIECRGDKNKCLTKAQSICGEDGYKVLSKSKGDPDLYSSSSRAGMGKKPERYKLSINCKSEF